MKLVSLFLATLIVVDGFQFMKNWKLPTRDKNRRVVAERFGDKSKFGHAGRSIDDPTFYCCYWSLHHHTFVLCLFVRLFNRQL
jgi:hypothetical protein